MDSPLPDDFDLAKHYGDAGDDDGYDSQKDEDDGSDGYSTYDWPERPSGKPAPKLSNLSHEPTSVYQRLIDFAVSLIAPPRNAGAPEMRRHAVALSVAVAMIYGYIAISWGAMESIGISGFAKADDLETLQNESAEVRVTLYGVAIRDLYRSKCNALNYQDELTLNDQLQVLQVKYQRATGVPYLLPACPKRE